MIIDESEIMKFAPIQTERTVLREFEEKDLSDIFEVLSNPKVMKFSTKGTQTLDECKVFLSRCMKKYKETPFGLLAIELKETQQVVGYCGFNFETIDDIQEQELTYRIHPDHWNTGLGTETAKAVLDFGIENLNFKRVVSVIEKANISSIRVAEKNGFRVEKEVIYQDKIPAIIYMFDASSYRL